MICDPADHVPLVEGRTEVDADELFRPGNEMHVCVVEPRQQQPAAGVDDLCLVACQRAHVLLTTNSDDAAS